MIYERLIQRYKEGRVPFSMPGHKQGRGLAEDLLMTDTTELIGGVDLHHRSPDVVESERAMSEFYKSRESCYMVGGSTAGVHASILSTAKTCDTIALTRTCHVSAVNLCAIAGINAVMIPQRIDPQFLIPEPVRAEDIEETLREYPNVKLVMITSPSYYGQCADVAEISWVCRKRGIPLIADAAHGAHFIIGEPYPKTALSQGADIEINSAHKTLDALTGAAYIHIGEGFADSDRLRRALSMVQSSSPPYPILASAERAWMRLSRERDKWQELARRCGELKREIGRVRFMDNDDPSRLVMSFADFDITGHRAAEYLSEHGIDVELGDHSNVVCIASASNTEEDFERLAHEVNALADTLKPAKNPPKIKQIQKKACMIYPQAGFWQTDRRLSDKTVMIYPPAVPITAMGEVKEEEA